MKIIFDIETGAYPESKLLEIMPEFEAAKNIKDPAKIAAQIAEKEKEFIEDAAKNALSSHILSIGWKVPGGDITFLNNDTDDEIGEKKVIGSFMELLKNKSGLGGGYPGGFDGHRLIGHNIKRFDCPYILRRCWLHGIKAPVYEWSKRYTDTLIDTYEVWSAGEYQAKGRLNDLAQYFGLGKKTGTGEKFSQWWRNGERERSIEYLKQDIELTEKVAEKLGIID